METAENLECVFVLRVSHYVACLALTSCLSLLRTLDCYLRHTTMPGPKSKTLQFCLTVYQ